MAVRMFAAIDVGSFALELGIYEISDKTGIRNVEAYPSCDRFGKRYLMKENKL